MSSGARYWRTNTTSPVAIVVGHHHHGAGVVDQVAFEAVAVGGLEGAHYQLSMLRLVHRRSSSLRNLADGIPGLLGGSGCHRAPADVRVDQVRAGGPRPGPATSSDAGLGKAGGAGPAGS